MKGTKSAKSKKGLSAISAALQGEALKTKMPNYSKMISTKSASKMKMEGTKSAKSTKGSTALVTKSDPIYSSKGVNYSEDLETNLKTIMSTADTAEKDMTDRLKTIKANKRNRK